MASNEKEEGDIRDCRATGGCLFKDTRGWMRGQITGLKSFHLPGAIWHKSCYYFCEDNE